MTTKIKLKKISFFSKDYKKIKNLYEKSFPDYERINLAFLTIRTLKNNIELLAIYDQNKFIGFSYLVSKKDLTLILYLAIDDNLQGQGYGTKFLEKIKDYKKNKRIILEIESLKKEAHNYQQRLKRKNFYSKNKFISSGLMAKEKEEEYEILSLAGETITKADYLSLLKRLLTPILFKFYKPEVHFQ